MLRTPEANADSHVKEDYRLGPGDLLTIRIVDVAKHEQIRVSNSGKDSRAPPRDRPGLRHDDWRTGRRQSRAGCARRPDQGPGRPGEHRQGAFQSRSIFWAKSSFPVSSCSRTRCTSLISSSSGRDERAGHSAAYLYRRTPVRPDKELVGSYNSTDWSDEVLTIDFERIAAAKTRT